MKPGLRLRTLLLSFVIPCLGLAQDTAAIVLARYTNDSLGFSIDLPCIPEQSPSEQELMFTCDKPPFSIMISSDGRQVKDDMEFDILVSSLVSGEWERMSIQGHMARRIHVTEGARHWEILFVASDDRVLLFSFGSSTDMPSDPRMLRSLLLH